MFPLQVDSGEAGGEEHRGENESTRNVVCERDQLQGGTDCAIVHSTASCAERPLLDGVVFRYEAGKAR